MKNIWHRIFIQTLYLKTCLPTRQDGFQNSDKVYFVDEILKCDHSNESYRAVPFCGAVYYAVQGGSSV